MEKLIKELYDEWEVDSHLTEPEYIKFVKDTYQVLVEKAKSGKVIFYGELPAFNQLKERFKDVASKLIGSIVGACSEYEATKGRPIISAIVISKDTVYIHCSYLGYSVYVFISGRKDITY